MISPYGYIKVARDYPNNWLEISILKSNGVTKIHFTYSIIPIFVAIKSTCLIVIPNLGLHKNRITKLKKKRAGKSWTTLPKKQNVVIIIRFNNKRFVKFTFLCTIFMQYIPSAIYSESIKPLCVLHSRFPTKKL